MSSNTRKSGELTPIDTQHPIQHMQIHPGSINTIQTAINEIYTPDFHVTH